MEPNEVNMNEYSALVQAAKLLREMRFAVYTEEGFSPRWTTLRRAQTYVYQTANEAWLRIQGVTS